MPHSPNCICNLCSARRSYLSCAAEIIQRQFRLRARRAALALQRSYTEQAEEDRRAADLRGDCYFCIICTLPQGECDLCQEC